MSVALAIQTCSVKGCSITATESGLCFYHDRCPPEVVTPTVAARVLRETQMKTEIRHTVTEETRTLVEVQSEQLPQPQDDTVPSLTEKSLSGHTDYIQEKAATAVAYLKLQSGGEISLWLDFNPFLAETKDRAFIEDIVSLIQAYARKYPTVPKKKDGNS